LRYLLAIEGLEKLDFYERFSIYLKREIILAGDDITAAMKSRWVDSSEAPSWFGNIELLWSLRRSYGLSARTLRQFMTFVAAHQVPHREAHASSFD
jgi:hypothetical protein